MNIRQILKLKPLLKDFWQFSPSRTLLVLALMLLSSLTASIGIVFIVPLLQAIQIDIGSSLSNDIGNKINSVFNGLGVTLNLLTVLIVYLTIIIIKGLISFASSVLSTKLQSNFIVSLRDKHYRELFQTKWQFLNQEHMADFIRLITGQVEMVGFCLQQVLSLCNNLILVCVYLGLAIIVSPQLTLLAMALALILVIVMLPINSLIHRSGMKELSANTNIFRQIFEQISHLKIIKSFSAEDACLEKMHAENQLLEKQQIQFTIYNSLTRFINLVGAATIFTLLFYTAINILELPIANLLVVLFIFSRLMPQVSTLQSTVMQLIHQAPSYTDLLVKSAELRNNAEITQHSISKEPEQLNFNSEITLKHMAYSYPNTDKYAITNVNSVIKKNQSVAITGPSGVGKSTIADILSGLLLPDSGEISIDGVNIDEQNQYALRNKVAYVTQETYLFHQTVRENLTWLFKNDSTEEQLWNALKLASADNFVNELPEGLDTLIGDNGIKLSGGERQRIALARALLAKPEILILDEATSALDRDNELKIRDALINLEGQLTIIVIAHNDTTIEHISHRINLVEPA